MTENVATSKNGSQADLSHTTVKVTATITDKGLPGFAPKPVSDEAFRNRIVGADADWVLYLAMAILIAEIILALPRN